MEFIDGKPLLEYFGSEREKHLDPETLASRNEKIKKISRNFFWCMCNQIFRDGFFHADPHPENIFVLSQNRIGFVDFGETGRLPDDVKQILIRHLISIYRWDFEQAVKEILASSFQREAPTYKIFAEISFWPLSNIDMAPTTKTRTDAN